MFVAYRSLLLVHVAFGFLGLVAFWVPVFAEKGGRVHVRAGRVFLTSAYVVAGTAFAIALLTVVSPFGTHPEARPADPADLPAVLAELRVIEAFLGYLAIITLASVHHGVRAIRNPDPASLRTPFHTALNAAAMAAGVGVLVLGLTMDHPARWILVALSPLGLLIGGSALRYARRPKPSRMAHWYEHLGAMGGGGIAFHTAFAVFGIQRFIDYGLEGLLGLVPWVAPAIVGTVLIALATRRFKARFGET